MYINSLHREFLKFMELAYQEGFRNGHACQKNGSHPIPWTDSDMHAFFQIAHQPKHTEADLQKVTASMRKSS